MKIRNPWPMVGRLDKCWLLTFKTPKKEVLQYLPPGFSLVDFESKKGLDESIAYWNVVVCRIGGMRPKLCPAWAGLTYWHVAYRLYVRVHPKNHTPIEGLYFVRSDCDSRLISATGNILTDFNFNFAQVSVQETKGDEGVASAVEVKAPNASMKFSIDPTVSPRVASGSMFGSPDEAARVLAYKPFGLASKPNRCVDVLAIKRDESKWKYSLIHVQDTQFEFFKGKQVTFEVGVELDPIQYQWNPGKLLKLE